MPSTLRPGENGAGVYHARSKRDRRSLLNRIHLVENAIRPTAVGKKNWLFFGSEEAGQRSAVMYTLLENCRLHGVEPYAYLKDVLERLPCCNNRDVGQLTPLNWQQAR